MLRIISVSKYILLVSIYFFFISVSFPFPLSPSISPYILYISASYNTSMNHDLVNPFQYIDQLGVTQIIHFQDPPSAFRIAAILIDLTHLLSHTRLLSFISMAAWILMMVILTTFTSSTLSAPTKQNPQVSDNQVCSTSNMV